MNQNDMDLIRLIVVEESANDAEVILNSLRKARYPIRPRHIEDAEDFENALAEQEWDIVISVPKVGNPDIGEFTIHDVCEIVKASKQDVPIVAICQSMKGEGMATMLGAGATQVVPQEPDTALQMVVGRELENLHERRRRKHIEQLYRETQRHNKMLLESSRDAIAYVHDGMHIHANPSYLEMFAYKTFDDLEGMPVMDLVSMDDQPKFKDFMREYMSDDKEEEKEINLTGLKSNSKKFKLKMEVSQAIYDSERCVQIIIRDQSQSQELERKLKEANQRDQLTGLYNRQYFIELLDRALAKVLETHMRGALLYIALDNFSSADGKVGVGERDAVIKNIATVLNQFAQGGSLGRFGDSIFTLLMMDKDTKYAAELAEKMCKTIEGTVNEVGDHSIFLTCSIGIAQLLASAAGPEDALQDAHAACRKAFKEGGNRHEIYKATVKTTEQGGVKIADVAKMIETAIEENRLSLRYQPIVSLHGETQEIYEVFLRMVDAEGENVPPGALFTAAEQANLTAHLDKWVLKEAVKVLMTQKKAGHENYFFIKLSDQAIKDETVLLYIRKLLKSTQLPGEQLVFELSESVAIGQVKLARAFINNVKNMKCKIALEHFGTGLNSSTTLKHLPVDYVKIDASFVRGLANNADNQKSIEEIVKIAQELSIMTIAESVEDANSLTILWQCEVGFAQGHYIQEPSEELDYDFEDEE